MYVSCGLISIISGCKQKKKKEEKKEKKKVFLLAKLVISVYGLQPANLTKLMDA